MAINTNSAISNIYSAYTASSKTDDTEKTGSSETTGKTGNYGKTIGNARLSEEGAKYYEELKKKYANMDFILVSSDQKANAQANAASYANSSKMVVLIDEDKVERMATDENYRKQYEAIISNASSGVSQLKASIESSGMSSRVQGYGMKINDGGTASFFAVLKKSSADQKARIEKKAEEKKAEKKAAEKKAEEKKAEEKATEKKAEKKAKEESLQKSREADDDTTAGGEDTVTITANSIEELIQKMNDYAMEERSDSVWTDYEKTIGQNIDFRG